MLNNKIYKLLIKDISKIVKSHILNEDGYNYAQGGDEFYTRPQDAEKELQKFKNYYAGKIIYCNCDDPTFSEIYLYLKRNFNEFKLKQLWATYITDNQAYFHKFNGIKNIKKPIESGRFQDNEDKIKKADIIMSSPPFSKKQDREYLNLCLKYNKDFLFIAPLKLPYKDNFLDLFKQKKFYVDNTTISKFKNDKKASCCWITSFPVNNKKLDTGLTFNDVEHIYDDKHHYLICQYFKNIPMDYKGIIATSEFFITKINLEQFEILGHDDHLKVNGKNLYNKLLIKFR